MKKILFLFTFWLASLFVANQVLAVSASTNYKVYGGQVTAVPGSAESTNYSSDISGGSAVSGSSESTNYKAEQGGALDRIPVPEASVEQNGGGGLV